jgi:Lrp/AsnC family transcriptional regulator of ectoine degradation
LEYQDFIKKILKADIGLNRYFSYAVLNTIKDTNQIPESLIKKSTIAK